MCRIGLFASLLASTACLMAVDIAQAVVIYSENFDGGTNGQSILDSPFSYIENFGELGPPAFTINDATPFGPSLAVNGAVNTSGLTLAYKDITGPSGTAGTIYTLTADLYAHSGTDMGTGANNDSAIGLAKPTVNDGLSFNNAGVYIHYARNNEGNTGEWRIDARGVRSGTAATDVFALGTNALLAETIVHATIKIDIDANTVTGTVTDGVTTLTHSFVGGNDFSNITRFVIQQRYNGIDIDNVLIQENTATAVPGDFDGDGDVDGADFVVWQTHFPTASGATLADGDADDDGDVDGADFVVWQTNFPFTPGPGMVQVPEPMSLILMVIGGLITLSRWRRRG